MPCHPQSIFAPGVQSAAVPAAVSGERVPNVPLDFGPGRRAQAETRKPEDLPARASLFRWTG
jgi:hypothetical protein